MDSLWAEMPLFLAIARTGTISGAADQLDVNRTTVARRLKTLEQKTGAKLFAGNAGRYDLTPLGRDLLAVAEAAEAALYKSEAFLFDGQEEPTGPLKVSVPPHLMQIAAPLFVDMANRFPALEIDIVATYQLTALEAREVDLGLRILRRAPQFPIYGRMVRSFGGAVFRAVNHKPDREIQVLRHGEVELPAGMKELVQGKNSLITDDIWVKQELIAAGGIGRLPLFMGDADPRLERASSILPDAGWRLWLVTQDAFRASPRLSGLIEEISRYFRALPPEQTD